MNCFLSPLTLHLANKFPMSSIILEALAIYVEMYTLIRQLASLAPSSRGGKPL
jgi:hypothetical protein